MCAGWRSGSWSGTDTEVSLKGQVEMGRPSLTKEVIRERRARSQFVESFSSRHKTSGLSPSIIETGCSGIRLLTLVLGK